MFDDDPLSAARGIFNGLVGSAIMVLAVVALVYWW